MPFWNEFWSFCKNPACRFEQGWYARNHCVLGTFFHFLTIFSKLVYVYAAIFLKNTSKFSIFFESENILGPRSFIKVISFWSKSSKSWVLESRGSANFERGVPCQKWSKTARLGGSFINLVGVFVGPFWPFWDVLDHFWSNRGQKWKTWGRRSSFQI